MNAVGSAGSSGNRMNQPGYFLSASATPNVSGVVVPLGTRYPARADVVVASDDRKRLVPEYRVKVATCSSFRLALRVGGRVDAGAARSCSARLGLSPRRRRRFRANVHDVVERHAAVRA